MNLEYLNSRKGLLDAIKDIFYAYDQYGARSNKKLIPIHTWFAKEIITGFGKTYSVRSLGTGGEYVIEGKYYPKVLDITIFYNIKPIVTLSFKFVTKNIDLLYKRWLCNKPIQGDSPEFSLYQRIGYRYPKKLKKRQWT